MTDIGRKKTSLSTRILVGLIAGVGCGLFFGEYCSWPTDWPAR